MKAIWQGTVLAEAGMAELIRIEGNWYFPPRSLDRSRIKASSIHTICPWKGEASYYDAVVDGQVNEGAIWYYPTPKAAAIERVGKDFTNYLAFWRGVTVEA